jgi:hypothetical protein
VPVLVVGLTVDAPSGSTIAAHDPDTAWVQGLFYAMVAISVASGAD